jgi:hypothetical protein
MKSTVLSIAILAVCTLVSFISNGQSSLSVSFPMIWSDVKVKDNWTPSTAPNYKEYREGSAFGYGISLNYSFQPKFLIKDKHFSVNVGAGYFNQRFDVVRPFNYDTPLLLIVRTDNYSYKCWYGAIGLTYNYNLSKKYILTGGTTFNLLQSYRQVYVPNTSNTDMFPPQVNDNHIDYGKIFYCNVGLSRTIGERIIVGLSLVVPIYTRWRNDRIFDDDPLTFSRPDFSLGSEISAAYHFKKQQP